jgi:predicted transcriptional regulator
MENVNLSSNFRTWSDVERRRAELEMSKAELARRAGIPENTIHKGIKTNSNLRPSTASVVENALTRFADEQCARGRAA